MHDVAEQATHRAALGPVVAAGIDVRLDDEFNIQAVTQGIDALADVTIRIQRGNDIYTGRGANTDIVVASARAYMHALNKLIDRVTPSAADRETAGAV